MYSYRSKGTQFGFRADATTKLMFSNTDETPVANEGHAIQCENYVDRGVLERMGNNPLEGKSQSAPDTTIIGPGGAKSKAKKGAPNFDVREPKAKPEPDTDPKPKGK